MLTAGTVDVKEIVETPHRVIDYVVKRIGNDIEYTKFITPDEFRRF